MYANETSGLFEEMVEFGRDPCLGFVTPRASPSSYDQLRMVQVCMCRFRRQKIQNMQSSNHDAAEVSAK